MEKWGRNFIGDGSQEIQLRRVSKARVGRSWPTKQLQLKPQQILRGQLGRPFTIDPH